jgi:hypothetical protein
LCPQKSGRFTAPVTAEEDPITTDAYTADGVLGEFVPYGAAFDRRAHPSA